MDIKQILSLSPDLVICRDGQNKITFVNQAFTNSFGKTAGEWIGEEFSPAASGAQIGAFDHDRSYGLLQQGGQTYWIEWIDTQTSNNGTLSVGRLNRDRRFRAMQIEALDERRKNKTRAYGHEQDHEQNNDCNQKASATAVKNTPVQHEVTQTNANVAASQPGAPSPSRPTTPIARAATRVLLAEDDALNAKLAMALLEKEACVVTHVEDGKKAVEAARATEYDLVFMDMRMPVMDGLQATKNIRLLGGNWAKIPIVALTANAFSEDRKACHQAGMNGFLTKPISVDALIAARHHWTNPQKQAKTG